MSTAAGSTSSAFLSGTPMPDYDQNEGSARENLCRFLAACYYQPDPAFTEERMFDSMLDAAHRIHPDFATLARHLRAAFAAQGLDSLLVEYTRLFLGPTRALARPYGSTWLEGQGTVMGDSTSAVLQIYQAGGFEIAEDFRELPDHIAAELEYLYLLIFRENEAHRDGKPAALSNNAALRKEFLQNHLGRWVGPFTTAVSAGAQNAFYRELAGLTNRFVAMEADRVITA
jgi:TorA maturation chaperone TorD